MHKIILAILISACQLVEEPTQQVKNTFAAGDVVFDAQDIGRVAVMQCQDASCLSKDKLAYSLHQVAFSGEKIEDVLQLDNLHVSFAAGNKHYTCLRLSAPLGKMILLWGDDKKKYCYEQEKNKHYVQQFASACVAEEDWQLVAKSTADEMKGFACQKDEIEIASSCFVAGDGCSETQDWPAAFKEISSQVAKVAASKGTKPEGTEINADTLLKDVKIMAEWKLAQDVDCNHVSGSFVKSEGMSSYIELTSFTDGKIDDLEAFSCNTSINNFSIVTFEAYYFLPHGICINTNTAEVQSLDACQEATEYIKITFAPKDD